MKRFAAITAVVGLCVGAQPALSNNHRLAAYVEGIITVGDDSEQVMEIPWEVNSR